MYYYIFKVQAVLEKIWKLWSNNFESFSDRLEHKQVLWVKKGSIKVKNNSAGHKNLLEAIFFSRSVFHRVGAACRSGAHSADGSVGTRINREPQTCKSESHHLLKSVKFIMIAVIDFKKWQSSLLW